MIIGDKEKDDLIARVRDLILSKRDPEFDSIGFDSDDWCSLGIQKVYFVYLLKELRKKHLLARVMSFDNIEIEKADKGGIGILHPITIVLGEGFDKALKKEKASKKYKIIFKDNGELFELNKKIIINKYLDKHKASEVCRFFFGSASDFDWHSWDEVIDDSAEMPNKKHRKFISDSIKLINVHAVKKLGEPIIDKLGQEKYKRIF